MRGILSILIGALIIVAGPYLVSADSVGAWIGRALLVITGGLLCWGGIARVIFEINKQRARANGDEQHGQTRLAMPVDNDTGIAEILFNKGSQEWLVSINFDPVADELFGNENVLEATAWLGKDGRLYAIEVSGSQLPILSPGAPVTDGLRSWIAYYGKNPP